MRYLSKYEEINQVMKNEKLGNQNFVRGSRTQTEGIKKEKRKKLYQIDSEKYREGKVEKNPNRELKRAETDS